MSAGGGAWANPYSYAHLGGANALFGDGSVHFIKEAVAPQIIVSLVTRSGGEIISADSY